MPSPHPASNTSPVKLAGKAQRTSFQNDTDEKSHDRSARHGPRGNQNFEQFSLLLHRRPRNPVSQAWEYRGRLDSGYCRTYTPRCHSSLRSVCIPCSHDDVAQGLKRNTAQSTELVWQPNRALQFRLCSCRASVVLGTQDNEDIEGYAASCRSTSSVSSVRPTHPNTSVRSISHSYLYSTW
jgi:hypothetical protein